VELDVGLELGLAVAGGMAGEELVELELGELE